MLRTARCYSTTTNYVVFSPKVVYNMSQEFFTDDLRPVTSFFNKVISSMKQVLLWVSSSKAGGRRGEILKIWMVDFLNQKEKEGINYEEGIHC